MAWVEEQRTEKRKFNKNRKQSNFVWMSFCRFCWQRVESEISVLLGRLYKLHYKINIGHFRSSYDFVLSFQITKWQHILEYYCKLLD